MCLLREPLPLLPQQFFQEHSPSNTLLVLDLGHIAFRRDDAAAAAKREGGQSAKSSLRPSAPSDALLAASPFSSDPENHAASGGGMFGPGTIVDDPLMVDEGFEDVAQNDWRLDVSGVQVRRNRSCGAAE